MLSCHCYRSTIKLNWFGYLQGTFLCHDVTNATFCYLANMALNLWHCPNASSIPNAEWCLPRIATLLCSIMLTMKSSHSCSLSPFKTFFWDVLHDSSMFHVNDGQRLTIYKHLTHASSIKFSEAPQYKMLLISGFSETKWSQHWLYVKDVPAMYLWRC